jgi:hypothetical protein
LLSRLRTLWVVKFKIEYTPDGYWKYILLRRKWFGQWQEVDWSDSYTQIIQDYYWYCQRKEIAKAELLDLTPYGPKGEFKLIKDKIVYD